METGLLREFIVLAEEKNYWRAAERLFMNQSTLSKHIKALEKALEVPLFQRTTRVVELTDYGRVFLPYAQILVQTEAEAAAALRRQQEYHSNSIRINTIPALAQYGLSNLLVSFHKENPDHFLHVDETDSYTSRRALSQRQCELAFCWDIPSALPDEGKEAVVRLPFAQDRLVAVVARSHPLAGRKSVSLLELKDEHLCFLKGYPFDLAHSACWQAGFVPRVACTTDFIDNILDVISDGGHTALLMERYIQCAGQVSSRATEEFITLKITPAVHAALSLCYLQDVPLSPAGQRFLDFFHAWMGRQPGPTA